MKFRRTFAAAFMGVALAASGVVHASASTTAALTSPPIGLTRLLAAHPTGPVVGIASLDAVPDSAAVARLRAVGLQVQPMKHLPLAIVSGSAASLQQAITTGAANDVYPDEHVQLLDTASSNS